MSNGSHGGQTHAIRETLDRRKSEALVYGNGGVDTERIHRGKGFSGSRLCAQFETCRAAAAFSGVSRRKSHLPNHFEKPTAGSERCAEITWLPDCGRIFPARQMSQEGVEALSMQWDR